MKKSCLYVSLIFVFLLASTALAQAATITDEDAAWQKVVEAGKKEGVVNFVATELAGRAGIVVAKAFKDKYGITLELIPGRIMTAVEKIKMEQQSKSYTTDALDTFAAFLLILKNGGYLESVAATLPALKEKNKFGRNIIEDPEAELLAVLDTFACLWVNTGLVKTGQEPKSFKDLLDPKWKGKMIFTNPLYSTAADQLMTSFSRGNRGLNEDFFVKLFKSGALTGTNPGTEAADMIVRGEVALGGPLSGSTGLKPFLAGAPIKALDLKEGTLFMPTRWGAIKNAPHPNATKVFINWLLSREGQIVFSSATGMEGVRNDIPPVMPFDFKGPKIYQTYEEMVLIDKRNSENYFANLLGVKR